MPRLGLDVSSSHLSARQISSGFLFLFAETNLTSRRYFLMTDVLPEITTACRIESAQLTSTLAVCLQASIANFGEIWLSNALYS